MHAHHKLAYLRRQACRAQAGLCFYCCRPMGKDVTAEHLVARCDGGKDQRGNIVAAHRSCNHDRHARYGGSTPDICAFLIPLEIEAGLRPAP